VASIFNIFSSTQLNKDGKFGSYFFSVLERLLGVDLQQGHLLVRVKTAIGMYSLQVEQKHIPLSGSVPDLGFLFTKKRSHKL
jgi:hypothetical protein